MAPKILEELPYPTSGAKSDIICWIVRTQQRDIFWWRSAFISLMCAFITYVVTGKIIWGTLVP